ncbi:hypothetical protein CRG98_025135 [Punica granatum]|uniref:Uncharacterized protein n=1 Tax=Punica granatum TaxID=22663 RepID=A0A2I0JDX4_PUNGR|nr:hypothetical protein CRG98_025135 [Punica granatum]
MDCSSKPGWRMAWSSCRMHGFSATGTVLRKDGSSQLKGVNSLKSGGDLWGPNRRKFRRGVGSLGRIGPNGPDWAEWTELDRRELGRLSYSWTGLGCCWTRTALPDAGKAVGHGLLGEKERGGPGDVLTSRGDFRLRKGLGGPLEEARVTGNARIRSRDGGPGRGVGRRELRASGIGELWVYEVGRSEVELWGELRVRLGSWRFSTVGELWVSRPWESWEFFSDQLRVLFFFRRESVSSGIFRVCPSSAHEPRVCSEKNRERERWRLRVGNRWRVQSGRRVQRNWRVAGL